MNIHNIIIMKGYIYKLCVSDSYCYFLCNLVVCLFWNYNKTSILLLYFCQRDVNKCDYYRSWGWQIIAERLIYSDKSEEEIKNYIDANNKISKRIKVIGFFRSNSFDYDHEILIPSEKYPYYKDQDAENYILLHYSTMMYGGNLYQIMVLVGFIVMLIICILAYKVNGNQ